MKPTRADTFKVVGALSQIIPFFPTSAAALDLITEFVLEFVGNDEQLQWFARSAGRSLARYEGMPHLRALFCTKYPPADGIQPLVEVEGMSEDQLEADFKRREMAANEARLEEYKRQAALAPPEDRAPLELPAVVEMLKPMPAPDPETERAGCPWCAAGFTRVRSSIAHPSAEIFVHPDTDVGRVICGPVPPSTACAVDL